MLLFSNICSVALLSTSSVKEFHLGESGTDGARKNRLDNTSSNRVVLTLAKHTIIVTDGSRGSYTSDACE